MKSFVITIHGDRLEPNDVIALSRHFASTYEQELIHKDAGPDAKGVYDIEFNEQQFQVVFGQGADVERIATPTPAENIDPASVDIPDGWAELKAADLRALAAKLTGSPVPNKAEAVAAIEAELARRTEAAPTSEGEG